MHNDLKEIILTEEEIQTLCKTLGEQITQDYQNKPLVCVGILKGSVMFMADLIKRIDTHLAIDFMDVSSYHGGTESTGEVQIIKDLGTSIENKDVLIIEDILETGTTLKSITELLQSRKVNSLEIVTLLDKPNRRKADIEAKYVGKKIPDEFVVGYGLDYGEHYRNLPYIGTLKPEVYTK
ncbi:hypoxanthine phosphoribosyltransferase [Staphylococcus lugdunensis]|jgi:hypoxanthine phosphoribosyltransferase|uniref:Hypoxanthine phosphoribosyltransferase n=1 Tax=Staphylococcus lugdunensis TaxID=28035 RepID=A0A133PZL5_STALU|nr:MULTISPECIES: hypoxanthine phosphoribosyltransferase [Staphylococcus]ADC88467.1 Hypoxanthine-guanine phosphoribosyltransferase [Staphylococcus lugdunensis HKU09-01]AMG61497.1 hypoxanthine phosphoribosyltransferase [Staphylococcus lugdunensis]AMG64558.1 hypoxanthine phosphoribosyltransferase [Staphylococcus lugdunensis]ARJ10131.1 hypoxanthine phosphoribosyltransferase [Staphylococcus lugdunensis]ARJ12319.1 hypoxanthine phosphoribosyltransferase [Staphylococcus lugdunensis]